MAGHGRGREGLHGLTEELRKEQEVWVTAILRMDGYPRTVDSEEDTDEEDLEEYAMIITNPEFKLLDIFGAMEEKGGVVIMIHEEAQGSGGEETVHGGTHVRRDSEADQEIDGSRQGDGKSADPAPGGVQSRDSVSRPKSKGGRDRARRQRCTNPEAPERSAQDPDPNG